VNFTQNLITQDICYPTLQGANSPISSPPLLNISSPLKISSPSSITSSPQIPVLQKAESPSREEMTLKSIELIKEKMAHAEQMDPLMLQMMTKSTQTSQEIDWEKLMLDHLTRTINWDARNIQASSLSKEKEASSSKEKGKEKVTFESQNTFSPLKNEQEEEQDPKIFQDAQSPEKEEDINLEEILRQAQSLTKLAHDLEKSAKKKLSSGSDSESSISGNKTKNKKKGKKK